MAYRDEVLALNPTFFLEFNNSWASSTSGGRTYSTMANTPTFVADGPKGMKAAHFDDGDYLAYGSSLPDFMAGDFTVDVWVRFTNAMQDYPTFLRRDGNGAVFLTRTRGPNTGSRINMIETYVSGKTVDTNPFTMNDGVWHMVTTVRSGSNAFLYIDGTQHTGMENGSVAAGGTGNSPLLFVGTGAGPSELFQGDLANVAIYHDAHSTALIQQRYNAEGVAAPAVPFRGWGIPAR